MKDYKRLTNRDLVLTLNYNNGFEDDKRRLDYASRLWELENKIESGELVDRNEYLDYLLAAKNTSELTDKEIEFFAKHNARVRKNANAEIARLTAENTGLQATISKMERVEKELRERLEKAVELPCKVGDAIFYVQYFCDYKGCDSATQQFCCGCKEMIEREKRKEKYVICEKSFALKDFEKIGKKYFTTRKAAEARLAELKGGKE